MDVLNPSSPPPLARRLLPRLLVAALGVLAAGSLAWGVVKALGDSADLELRSREAARFRQRLDPYAEPSMTYPPSAPPFFAATVPLSSLRLRRGVWLGLNLFALAAAALAVVRVWGRAWPGWLQISTFLAFAAAKPARASTAMGQFSLIPVALLLWAEGAVVAGRQVVAGVLVGVSLVKPTMGLPYLILLACRRRWTAVVTALGVQAALLAATSIWLSIGPATLVREWLELARGQLAEGTIDAPSVLQRYAPSLHVSGSAVSLVVLAVSTSLLWAFRDRSSLGTTALALYLAAILTYHRPYDLTLMLPALAYFVDRAIARRPAAALCAGWLFLLLLPPAPPDRMGWVARLYLECFTAAAYLGLVSLILYLWTEPNATPGPAANAPSSA